MREFGTDKRDGDKKSGNLADVIYGCPPGGLVGRRVRPRCKSATQAGSQPDLPEKREEIVIGLNKSQKRSQEVIGNKRVCPQSSPLKPLKWIWPQTTCVLFP